MSQLSLNKDLLLTINKDNEYMYWDTKANILEILKNYLHESLSLAPIKILTIHFCNLKIFKLQEEVPPKN
jgi:hypothetical protein